jgi:hypothetical protein
MMDKAPESLVGEMNIMDASGHKQLTWTTDNLEETAAAKETFDLLISKGYTAFGSEGKAEAKHSIKEFDPAMKEMVMVPRTVGG